ncbi:hypothetical protein [Arthrobacter ipis]|nr:hypothetical protein [Arthrobacter ipis]
MAAQAKMTAAIATGAAIEEAPPLDSLVSCQQPRMIVLHTGPDPSG